MAFKFTPLLPLKFNPKSELKTLINNHPVFLFPVRENSAEKDGIKASLSQPLRLLPCSDLATRRSRVRPTRFRRALEPLQLPHRRTLPPNYLLDARRDLRHNGVLRVPSLARLPRRPRLLRAPATPPCPLCNIHGAYAPNSFLH